MAPEQPKPLAGSWYKDLEQELRFTVLAVGEETIDIQYDDGTVEELDFGSWDAMTLAFTDPPEAWPTDFKVNELGRWDTASHPEGAPRPLSEVEGAEPDRGPQKSP